MTKKIILIISSIGLTAFISGCVKNIQDTTIRQDDFSTQAKIQIINVSVATTRNSVFVDGVPINYATFVYGGQFPVAPNTSFAIKSGLRNILIRDTSSTVLTQPQMGFAQDFAANKFYTIFMYDTINSVKQLIVENDIVVPTDTTARVRFANFAYLPGGAPAIDIFSKNRNANVATNLALTQVTPFIPFASASDSLFVRETANPANALDTLVLNPTRKRSYTLVFRGRYRTNEAGGAVNPRVLTTFTTY